jgi:hypothetical protein
MARSFLLTFHLTNAELYARYRRVCDLVELLDVAW